VTFKLLALKKTIKLYVMINKYNFSKSSASIVTVQKTIEK